ncbi:MAG TPA: adenosylcobinamide amidohydrolase [Acidimicrobiales bacterium]
MDLLIGPVFPMQRQAGHELPVMVCSFPQPMRSASSAPHGGGVGPRRWVLNAQVPSGYGRLDPDDHVSEMAMSLGLEGEGVGMLTAVDVRSATTAVDGGARVIATVGLGSPTLAAAPWEDTEASLVGTINLVVAVPERLSDAALVNAVATATEAKAQALWDLGLRATGTATDAVCVLSPEVGRPSAFGGPRSVWGSRIARAVHAAVVVGGRE